MKTVPCFDTFSADTRPHDFRQTIAIDCLDTETLVEFRAHRLTPGLGSEEADLQLPRTDIVAVPISLFGNVECIGGCRAQETGAEVPEQCDLTAGGTPGDRHHRTSEALGTIVGPEATSEQAITQGIVHEIAGTGAGTDHGPGHETTPQIQILHGVADYRRPAGAP